MVVKMVVEVTGCSDCPLLGKGSDFGDDGRGSRVVYICKDGVFGSRKTGYCGYDEGPTSIPKIPPAGCKHFTNPAIDRVASKLMIDKEYLTKILEEEKCKLVDL